MQVSPTLTVIKTIFGKGESVPCRIVKSRQMSNGLNDDSFAGPSAVNQTAFGGGGPWPSLHFTAFAGSD
jgi:hypothetical protein